MLALPVRLESDDLASSCATAYKTLNIGPDLLFSSRNGEILLNAGYAIDVTLEKTEHG